MTLVSSDGALSLRLRHSPNLGHACQAKLGRNALRTGHRYILPRQAALGSEMIKTTLSSDFAETVSSRIELPDQRAEIVEKVAEYLVYKDRYKETKGEIPDFKDRIKPEIALEMCVFFSGSPPLSPPVADCPS